MEINKKKYREFLVNILNFVFDTKSFTANNNEDTKNIFHILSEELATVAFINFELDKLSVQDTIEKMLKSLDEIETFSDIESVIFISYTDFYDTLDMFYTMVDNNSRLEVDVWDIDILNNHFDAFELNTSEENFDTNAFEYNLTNLPEYDSSKSISSFEKSFKQLDYEFFKKKKQITVLYDEMLASGKTLAAIEYVISRKDKFKHFSYIRIYNDIRIDFLNAFMSLSYGFKYNKSVNAFQNYYDLLSELKLFYSDKDKKHNLLIFDQVNSIQEFAIINEIAKATNFKVLIVSLEKSLDYPSIGLATPSNDEVFDRLKTYIGDAKFEVVENIFEPIDNNIFFADFLGSQIKGNKLLNYNDLLKNIIAKQKKVYRLNSYLSPNLKASVASKQQILLKYIMAVYEAQVKDFSQYQKQILMLLSVLPQIEITFDDLIKYLNISPKKTDEFVNELLDLQTRGWVQTSKKSIYVNYNVKKILHKKLKPNSSKLKKVISYLIENLKVYKTVDFKEIIISQNIVHNLLAVDEATVDLVEIISSFYSQIGYFDKSEYFSELAADFYEKILELKEPKIEELNRLIRFYIIARDFEKALYYNQSIYEFCLSKYGEDSLNTADAALNMAVILENMQDYYNAISFIEIALDIYEQYYNPDEDPHFIAIEIHNQISEKIEEQESFSNFSKFMLDFFDKEDK